MKINRLDAHDRLLELKKQSDDISRGCQDCIDSRPKEFGNNPFYIFAHKREIGLDERFNLMINGYFDDITKVPTHRMIWMPRLKKPEAQTNSMLFKYYPLQDVIKVIWIIPQPETWKESQKGKMLENNVVSESVHLFLTDKKKLEEDEDDDVSEERAKAIYAEIARNAKLDKQKNQSSNT